MSRLYTYLPKDNTALTEGLLSTALSDKGFEKYRGRTGKYKKEDVLKVLDSWEPEWTRSKAISALTQPIPSDAAEDFLNFAKDSKLYSFDTNDLIKAKILAHIRRARKGGGTDPVDVIKNERLNWHRKKKHLLFQGVPHYFVETTGGKIPPELVRDENLTHLVKSKLEKKAVSFSQDGSTFQLSAGETPWHAVKAWNSTNPSRKITTQQLLSANNGIKPTGYGIGKSYNTGVTAAQHPIPLSKPTKPVQTVQPAPPAKPVQQQQRPAGTPIGYWNNNPGNLMSDGRTNWNGISKILPKGQNIQFNDYSSGYRAMARTLYNYGAKHGIGTPKDTVYRFAKSDPEAQKTRYMNFIKSRTGWTPDQKIDLTNIDTLQKLVPIMADFEIGPAWTAKHDQSVVSNAVTRAIPPKIKK